MDDEIDRKIVVTAMQFLLVLNRHQTHDLTLIGSGANGLGIQEWHTKKRAFYEGILISFVVPMQSTFLALETYEKLLEF